MNPRSMRAIAGAVVIALMILGFSGVPSHNSAVDDVRHSDPPATQQELADAQPSNPGTEPQQPADGPPDLPPRAVFPDEPLSELDLMDAAYDKRLLDYGRRDADPPPPNTAVTYTTSQFRHQAPVFAVRFGLDGTEIATTTLEGFYRWRATTGELVSRTAWSDFTPAGTHAISPDMASLAAMSSYGSRVYVADTATGGLRYTLRDLPGVIQHLVFSADSKLLATSVGAKVYVWDSSSGALVSVIRADHEVRRLHVSDDVRAITTTDTGSLCLFRWDASTGQLLSQQTIEQKLDRPRFSTDGSQVIGWIGQPPALRGFDFLKGHIVLRDAFIVEASTNAVEVWNARDGQMVRRFDEVVFPYGLSPDGTRLVDIRGRRLQLWNVVTGDSLTPPSMRVYLRAVIATIADEDPFRLALHWAVPEGDDALKFTRGRPVARPFGEVLDTVETLNSLTFSIRAPSGRRQELRGQFVAKPQEQAIASRPLRLLDEPSLVFTLPKEGVQSANASQRFVGRWLQEEPSVLHERGVHKVSLRGRLVFAKGESLPFETGECVCERGGTTPLSQIRQIAEEKLKELLPARDRAKIRDYDRLRVGIGPLGVFENAVGQRCVLLVVDREMWNVDIYMVTVQPDGTPLRVDTWSAFTCVAEGTLIDTPSGAMPIEQLRTGDQVWSYDLAMRTKVPTTVRAIISSLADHTLLLRGSLRVTASHPIFASGSWKPAGDLTPYDWVLDRRGYIDTAGSAKQIEQLVKVFDLTVDPPHNFFAGGLLVHNKSVGYAPGAFDPWRVFQFKPPKDARQLWSVFPSR